MSVDKKYDLVKMDKECRFHNRECSGKMFMKGEEDQSGEGCLFFVLIGVFWGGGGDEMLQNFCEKSAHSQMENGYKSQ